MNKFLNLIQDNLNLINEEDPTGMPPAPAAPEAGAPPPPAPAPEQPVDAVSQHVADVDMARRLALFLPDIDSEDREKLIIQPTPDNLDAVRQAIKDVLNIYDTPS